MAADVDRLEEWAKSLATRDDLFDVQRDDPDFDTLADRLGREPKIAERDIFGNVYRQERSRLSGD